MEDYRIRVHALKSTAKMIGAENLSDLAKDLEMAAKEKDWDFIEKNHKEVLDQYAAGGCGNRQPAWYCVGRRGVFCNANK